LSLPLRFIQVLIKMLWRNKSVNRITRAAEALGVPKIKNIKSSIVKIVSVVLAVSSLAFNVGGANAATLTNASVAQSDPRPSATAVNYSFTGSTVTSAVIRCVKVTFSSSSSSIVTPVGFSAAAATVTAASSTLINSSATGWSATPTANTVTYTNATGVTPGTLSGATYILANITNSSVADTGYFYKLSTYGNVDCATTPVDNANLMFINTNGSTLSLTVDQTLTFTVNAVASGQVCNGPTSTQASTATTIPFGTITAAANGIVCQDLTASTNATNGYTIYARYTSAPTNAIAQTIADWTGTNAAPTVFTAPGTEAYGYNTNAAALGTGTAGRFTANKFAAMTTSNLEVAYQATGVNSTTNRIGHQVAISTLTKPGTYTTTIIYTCTPVY
jgi:hypothetical protein